MDDPMRELEPTLRHIADRWDGERTDRTLIGLERKRRRARTRARAAVAGGLLSLLAVGAFLLLPGALPRIDRAQRSQDALHTVLADGSHIWRRDAHSEVTVAQTSPLRSELELVRGAARFEVTRREPRLFRVRAGDVTVEVLGTVFDVERVASRTRVSVSRGRVAVSFHAERVELAAGEAGIFPPSGEAARLEGASGGVADELESSAAQPAAPATSPRSSGPAPHVRPKTAAARARGLSAAPSWRAPAEQGEFERAYELLARSPTPVADDVEELLLAADAARLSGHAAAALPFLQRVVERHGRDSRASLAAFTLGGVLMQQLGRPREAESAYARSRELAPNSSLAEDALARQVEAASRAGDAAQARKLAGEYVARYPSGRRLHAVQRFGSLMPSPRAPP